EADSAGAGGPLQPADGNLLRPDPRLHRLALFRFESKRAVLGRGPIALRSQRFAQAKPGNLALPPARTRRSPDHAPVQRRKFRDLPRFKGIFRSDRPGATRGPPRESWTTYGQHIERQPSGGADHAVGARASGPAPRRDRRGKTAREP